MSTTTRTLYISDEAYNTLSQRARDAGYIKSSSTTDKGMSKYVQWLMRQHLTDARPEDVSCMDAAMLQDGQSPEWRMYAPRRPHSILVAHATLIEAGAHALRLGVAYPPAKRILHAPTYLDGTQCLSTLLEAIGSDWIAVEKRHAHDHDHR